jgi:hypothetical protein
MGRRASENAHGCCSPGSFCLLLTPTAAFGAIRIDKVQYDFPAQTLGATTVSIRNGSGFGTAATGESHLTDGHFGTATGHVYHFGDFKLKAGRTVTVQPVRHFVAFIRHCDADLLWGFRLSLAIGESSSLLAHEGASVAASDRTATMRNRPAALAKNDL